MSSLRWSGGDRTFGRRLANPRKDEKRLLSSHKGGINEQSSVHIYLLSPFFRSYLILPLVLLQSAYSEAPAPSPSLGSQLKLCYVVGRGRYQVASGLHHVVLQVKDSTRLPADATKVEAVPGLVPDGTQRRHVSGTML